MTAQRATAPQLSVESLLDLFIRRVDWMRKEDLQQAMLLKGLEARQVSKLLKRCRRLQLLESSFQNTVPHRLGSVVTKAGLTERTLNDRFFLFELCEEQNRSIAEVSEVVRLGCLGANLTGVHYSRCSYAELNASLRLSRAYLNFIQVGNQPESWHRLTGRHRFSDLASAAIVTDATIGGEKYVLAPILAPHFNRSMFSTSCRRLEVDYEIC